MQRRFQYILVVALLVALNFLFSGFFRRFDLTKENRYSLSPISTATVDSLRYFMTMQVFIEGDFPPNIRRFQDAVRTTLQELQQYSHGYLDYEFINPIGNKELISELQKQGMPPIPVTIRKAGNETENKQLFPYAILRYRDKTQYIDLVKGCVLPSAEVDFLKAEGDLEYKLIAPMRNLMREMGGNIAFIEGQGETPMEQLGEWVNAVQNGYKVFKFNMRKNPGQGLAPTITEAKMREVGKPLPEGLRFKEGIDILVIAQPDSAFTEREKYELDQYLMRGGNLLFVMSTQKVDMDMYEKRSTLSMLRDVNLDDLFLKYGCKLNYNLLQDLSCEKTEVFMEGPSGGMFQAVPWIFYPMVYLFPNHPLARNVDNVLLRYANTIDTFHQDGVKKSVFLASSKDSRTLDGQQFINLDQYLQEKPPIPLFRNKGQKIVGVMMEGYFNSLFAGREIPKVADKEDRAPFGAKSALPGKIVLLADGQFALGKNFRGKRGYIPYDNKVMLMNAIDYLAGDAAITQIRSKDVEVRMLNKEKVINNTTLIRVLNLLLPILIVALFGYLRHLLRKRKHEKAS